jgi:hypothetical protein
LRSTIAFRSKVEATGFMIIVGRWGFKFLTCRQ